MFDFGMRIRQLREKYKMSQEELGARIERSKSVVSSYENNLKIPPLFVLTRIAEVFNCSLDYLVGFEKSETVSLEGMSDSQKQLLQTIAFELKDKSKQKNGLTERQQNILNSLINEFAGKF